MGETAIEWATDVWNPTTGCDRVSPGCAHCYALELAPKLRRFARARERKALAAGTPHTPGKWLDVCDGGKTSGPAFGLTLHPDALDLPLRQRGARTYFVNSMSDLFHEDVPDEYIAAVFGVMAAADQHTFQVLTKRPERMRAWFAWYAAEARDRELGPGLDTSSGLDDMPADLGFQCARSYGVELGEAHEIPWPLANVWLGVSIENRRFVRRADVLRETPAAVRFISAEPLLGPLVFDSDIGMATDRDWPHAEDDGYSGVPEHLRGDPYTPAWEDGADLPELDLSGIDWLIVGGESGKEHRPIREEWVRELRDACEASGTAFFFKQWGGRTPKSGGRLLDGRTWDEMPTSRMVPAR
jgi:protein gp37